MSHYFIIRRWRIVRWNKNHWNLTVKFQNVDPQVSSWFFTTKGIDCEEMTRDQADPTISGYSSNFQTLDARLKRVSPVVISGLQHF